MREGFVEPNENDDISCHLQRIAMGSLECEAAILSKSSFTKETTPAICFNCEVGKIHREIGCTDITAQIILIKGLSGHIGIPHKIFCNIRKRDTTLDTCHNCNLVIADTTKDIIKFAQSFFKANNFDSAYNDFENAKKSFRDGKFERTVSMSISSLESTMRICHDKLGEPLPNKKQISGLWKSTRDILNLDELDSSEKTTVLINSLSGVMKHMGGLRNELSDAHGKGSIKPDVSEIIAEFALNTSATLSTFIIRRYNQIKK